MDNEKWNNVVQDLVPVGELLSEVVEKHKLGLFNFVVDSAGYIGATYIDGDTHFRLYKTNGEIHVDGIKEEEKTL